MQQEVSLATVWSDSASSQATRRGNVSHEPARCGLPGPSSRGVAAQPVRAAGDYAMIFGTERSAANISAIFFRFSLAGLSKAVPSFPPAASGSSARFEKGRINIENVVTQAALFLTSRRDSVTAISPGRLAASAARLVVRTGNGRRRAYRRTQYQRWQQIVPGWTGVH